MLTSPGVELPQGPRPQRDAERFGEVTIACEGLWKVFGPNPRQLLDSEHARLPRKEMLAATGCVAAVRDASFEVRAGEVFVVMGLSGSGKSTLIRCLLRLVEPTAGQVSLEGEDILAASEQRLRDLRRHKVSMVFQHFGLLPHRTVLHNVAFGLEIQGQERKERLTKAAETLELVGLEGFGDSYPDELSGGMKQRVGLARALATDPDVLLFDEPFSALDPLIRRDMQAEVMRLQESVQKTMVFITHDLLEALKLGDRIAIMRDGDFVQVGTPEQVVGEPADDYVRDFTRDVPRTEVLTARAIMAPPRDAGDGGFGPSVWADTKLADLVPLVAADERPLCVFDEESRAVGVVDRLAVLGAVAGGER